MVYPDDGIQLSIKKEKAKQEERSEVTLTTKLRILYFIGHLCKQVWQHFEVPCVDRFSGSKLGLCYVKFG